MPSFFKNQKSTNNLRSQANQTSSEQAESSFKNLLSEHLTFINRYSYFI
ncbi:hypothetical protein [Priestia aryabhattai]|nr:hypothetical protein [Priestia aryabhattai]MCM3253143.1 hypothetical protein [Priestia aryabhattai]